MLKYIMIMGIGLIMAGCSGDDGAVEVKFDWTFATTFSDTNPGTPTTVIKNVYYPTEPGTYSVTYRTSCNNTWTGTYSVSAHAGSSTALIIPKDGGLAQFSVYLNCATGPDTVQVQSTSASDLAVSKATGMQAVPANDQAMEMMGIIPIPATGDPVVSEQIIGNKKLTVKVWKVSP